MPKRKSKPDPPHESAELRIIGGIYRGSKLRYELLENQGDPVTRPMKERVRESLFNLVSTECGGKHAFDLFAGTGALGLEALSRGATRTTFIEKHVPTSRVVEANIRALNVDQQCELLTTSAFLWGKRDLPKLREATSADDHACEDGGGLPWLVFCSPPYAFYVDRQEEMLGLIKAILKHCPPGSILLVEADGRFDFGLLPGGVKADRYDQGWDVRTYAPAVVGVWRT